MWQSLDVPRVVRRIAQRLAEFPDRRSQTVVKIHERVGGPDSLPELLADDEFPGTFEQYRQDLKGLLLQLDLYTSLAEFTGA
jgi:hypothetical protein